MVGLSVIDRDNVLCLPELRKDYHKNQVVHYLVGNKIILRSKLTRS